MAYTMSQLPLGANAQVVGAYDNRTGQAMGSTMNYTGGGYRGPGGMQQAPQAAPPTAWSMSYQPQYRPGQTPSGSAAPANWQGPTSQYSGPMMTNQTGPSSTNLGQGLGMAGKVMPTMPGGSMPPLSQVYGNAGIGSFGGQQYGGAPGNNFSYAQGLPGNIGGLIDRQMAENANARNQNLAIFGEAKNNLMGVMGRFDNDPLNQQARTNAMGMAQNYALDPQMAMNRASNLVNAAANSRQRSMMGDLAAAGQMGGSAQYAAQGMVERDRMAQLAGTGSDIQTQYGQLNFQRGLQATQQAQGLAGQRGGMDMGVANSFIGHLPQYKPEDYSAYGALLAMGPGGGAQSVGGASFAGAGGIPAGSPLAQWQAMIAKNKSGSVAGANNPFGFTPAGPEQYNPTGGFRFDASGQFDTGGMNGNNINWGALPPGSVLNPLSQGPRFN